MTADTPCSPRDSLPYNPASPVNHENDSATTIKEEVEDPMSILNVEVENSEPTIKSENESSVSSINSKQDCKLTSSGKNKLDSLFTPSPEPSNNSHSSTTDSSV